ncbi:MAG: carboxypeptidase regulatory-like domain-containing protein [Bacteroidales bacterium]|nr:carboxypeptidase regulatory-like domain-containing protein [Bacteroidales bacterium]
MKKILLIAVCTLAALSFSSCQKQDVTATLLGTVTYADHNMPGVDVTLTGDGGTYTFKTIKDGYYVIRGINPGDYIVSCAYNGKSVASYLINYEKSENPSKVTIAPKGYHVRNVMIPDTEDLGEDDEDDEE